MPAGVKIPAPIFLDVFRPRGEANLLNSAESQYTRLNWFQGVCYVWCLIKLQLASTTRFKLLSFLSVFLWCLPIYQLVYIWYKQYNNILFPIINKYNTLKNWTTVHNKIEYYFYINKPFVSSTIMYNYRISIPLIRHASTLYIKYIFINILIKQSLICCSVIFVVDNIHSWAITGIM